MGGYKPVHFVSMTQYDATFTNLDVAFRPDGLKNTMGEYLSGLGKTQLRIAETEKYAHVTFFFNGGVEAPNPGEDRALIPSPKVATYDLKPEMSAYEVTEEAVKRVLSGKYDLMVLNFANCDMVGHNRHHGSRDEGRAHRGRMREQGGGRRCCKWAARPSSPPITATPIRWWTR